MWTFGRKIALGFAICLLMLVGIGALAYRAIDTLTQTSYEASHAHLVMERITSLVSLMKDAETGQRGFVITGMDEYLGPYDEAAKALPGLVKETRQLVTEQPDQLKRLETLEQLMNAKMTEMKVPMELRRTKGLDQAILRVQEGRGKKLMDDIRTAAAQMEDQQRALLRSQADNVEKAASGARRTIVVGTLICLALAMLAGYIIVKSLTDEIASVVTHVRQSSTELQAAATQQSAGARESSTAMTEITTTISELLATSRQIADSAQRVTNVAQQTVDAARQGDGTVQRSSDAITGIRQQVDQIVNHMLDLGRKSQQIGAVLDIVSELAEQTNILAINATIEASGAGEAGRRFGVVADEIRKLADRVAGSTKEIRALIEDVRGAVNTTVMATETGSKAVDVGARLFADVTQAFGRIAELIGTTTDAAREIELSTKQQASAVEQVKIAIASTAQATKETEVSSGQTFQTATQLTDLSKDLLRLVQPQAV